MNLSRFATDFFVLEYNPIISGLDKRTWSARMASRLQLSGSPFLKTLALHALCDRRSVYGWISPVPLVHEEIQSFHCCPRGNSFRLIHGSAATNLVTSHLRTSRQPTTCGYPVLQRHIRLVSCWVGRNSLVEFWTVQNDPKIIFPFRLSLFASACAKIMKIYEGLRRSLKIYEGLRISTKV